MQRLAVVLSTVAVVLGCTAMPPSQASQSPTPQPQAAATAPAAPGFKNLQVFPKDIPRQQLIDIMKGFTRALGVRCNHCHVVTATEPKETFDFPSDAKEEKRVARVMLRMASEINNAWMPRVEAAEHPEAAAPPPPEQPKVSCWTCHRGKPEPENPPPPPADPPR